MRYALVTGTSRGLGLATARALLDRGWHVLGIARGDPALHADGYEHVRLDLRDLDALGDWLEHGDELRRAAADCARFGLVNNAGVLEPIAPTHRLGGRELAGAFLVNTIAPILLSGFVARTFGGVPVRIVDVSSGAAGNPYPGWSAYCSTKAALAMAGRVLATELDEVPALAGRDLAVVSYAPGVVETAMQDTIRAAHAGDFPRKAKFQEYRAQGKLVPPEGPAAEIAEFLGADGLPRHAERRFGG